MKILLVDDDAFLIDMYAAKFSSLGHSVDTAKSVELALEKLRAGAVYDAVLLATVSLDVEVEVGVEEDNPLPE